MSNQLHGKVFENLIKGNNKLYSNLASDRNRSLTAVFDIDKEDDIIRGIPSSIKSTGDDTIGMADARNFWKSFDDAPFRILIGCYEQVESVKEFFAVLEFFLEHDHRKLFFGEVTFDEIAKIHEGLKNFKKGDHKNASIWAEEQIEKIKSKLGILKLNRKVDSKSQRRLQCSVNLVDLFENINYKSIYTDQIGVNFLPYRISSPSRIFTNKKFKNNILKNNNLF